MHKTIIRLLIALICCLPTFAQAATDYSIHAEWTSYTPPSGYVVAGFNLYQEGVLACQVQDPDATAIDCTVSLTADVTNFTLTAAFNDGTESPHSSPFAFTAPTPAPTPVPTPTPTPTPTPETSNYSIHAEWTSYTPPSGYVVAGFNLYQEGVLACQVQDPDATAIDCTVSLTADTTNFTLTAAFNDGTESPHSSPFAFSLPSGTTTELRAVITTNTLSGQTPLSVAFDASSSTGAIASYQWDFGDGSSATGNTTTHVYSTADSYTATLTVTDAAGQTSTATTTVTATEPPITTPPAAVISSSTTTGLAPLTVTFDASSSTGAIASYQWDFGDGSTATGNTAAHIYTTAGAYAAKLTVTNATGLTSTASTTVTVTAPVIEPALPPTARISSSTAAGQAPLIVTFDGAGSTAAANATIASYSWSFGDGASATGATTSHTFAAAGTYNTALTVTDSKGLTSSTSTPVVVTAPVVTPNKIPTAIASATSLSGPAPLAVTFDGSASTDTDGTIASYIWNFGDGSTATGRTVAHTYISEASFTATLQVTDNQGAKNTASIPITVKKPDNPLADLNIELGEIAVSSNWVRVPFNATYTNPIVVAGPPSFANAEPCVVRLRNIDSTGFDIKLTEWNYQDGVHPEETITYLVMEKGRITLPDGSAVEAGSFTGTTKFKTVLFTGIFAKEPVMLTTIASTNEADTISGRIRNIKSSSFDYYFREQEKNRNTHLKETVNFIAWEPGKGNIGSVQFEAATTAKAVTNTWYNVSFKQPFTEAPLMLADMQTTSNTDASALRMQNVTETGFQVKVEEEQSKDSEVTHPAEMIGYLAINSTTLQASSTIWPNTAVPGVTDIGDNSAVEVGVKFRSDLNGFITGVRFYKASTNTGTHVANLWTSSGTLLATATFTNETTSGWQQVNFTAPVAITANTVYVASYHTNSGHYSDDWDYFAGKGMDSAPLHALADGTSGSNGVYAYGSSSSFPSNSWRSSNYWVDVVFHQ